MTRRSNLLRWVVQGPNFVRAYHAVKRNNGAPGVDGARAEDLPRYLPRHWERIKAEILSGTYRPQAVRGVQIPKPNGGTRQLGIPTVIDRLIQQSIHQQLSPIFEPIFSDYSYGFRAKRSAHQALEQANKYINSGRQWIIDLDLKSFFDLVNHNKLMELIARKIGDKLLLQLLRRYLKSGMQEGDKIIPRRQGTPQGGPLSPLLSNILLNELDKELEKRGHQFVRYADDCSIFLTSKRAAERVLASIIRFLEDKLYLKVNQEKTSICRPINFVLLGHSFVPSYQKGDKGKYRQSVAKKSWRRLKEKVKIITRKTTSLTFDERIEQLNQLLRGWVHYFRYASCDTKLKALDAWIRSRLRYCIWKSWKRPKRRLRAFRQLGVKESWAYRYAYSRKGGWRIANSQIMRTTITEEVLRKRGYVSFLEYYRKLKYGKPKASNIRRKRK